MQTPNENGVYEPDVTEELARRGRAYAAIRLCQCIEGLHRYSLDLMYSYGGFCGPITDDEPGYPTRDAARDAGVARLLARFPTGRHDPDSVVTELRELRQLVEGRYAQPSLF